MKTALVTLESAAPYNHRKNIEIEKLPKESSDELEQRTWRDYLHTNDEGNIVIPPIAFKKCLESCAKFESVKIAGKGQATYSKHFKAGIMVANGIDTGIKASEVKPDPLFVPRKDGVRVKLILGTVYKWSGTIEVIIIDDTIKENIFEETINKAGMIIGVGRWRPENGGMNGRFTVKKIEWKKK